MSGTLLGTRIINSKGKIHSLGSPGTYTAEDSQKKVNNVVQQRVHMVQ